jgi:hypothetical protein
MSPWIRLLEKLAGSPHRKADSEKVHVAAEAVKESSTRLLMCLELADPISALAMYSRSELNK